MLSLGSNTNYYVAPSWDFLEGWHKAKQPLSVWLLSANWVPPYARLDCQCSMEKPMTRAIKGTEESEQKLDWTNES